jgi:hypothetical protein
MRKLNVNDFKLAIVDEGTDAETGYYTCTMGNGIELAIEPIGWGYLVAAYDKHGILIGKKMRRPWLIEFGGGRNEKDSLIEAVALADAIYQKLITKVIDNVLPVW